MSNLKLVPDAPTPLEKMLMDASRAEQPSSEHKARLRAALGFGLPLSGPLAAPPPAPAPLPAAEPAAAALPVGGRALTFAKVAASVGAIALIGAVVLTREGSVPSAPVTAVAPSPVVVPVKTSAPPEELAVSPLPPVEEAAPDRARRPTRGGVASAASADLSEQILLIEAARAGVAGRDAKSALTALDSYTAKFPRGAFGQEAAVLRIRALDQSGDSARATALAKSFVARFPNSPHVARLKPIAERGASR
ncbi:MAG: hypothetical protein K0R38_1973 [Polyangiaceae bacterium]|jgi:hypothetical protein|nr:hypothetical protein [Polyangiaceae bacterium]